jgi:hypothetical protein
VGSTLGQSVSPRVTSAIQCDTHADAHGGGVLRTVVCATWLLGSLDNQPQVLALSHGKVIRL